MPPFVPTIFVKALWQAWQGSALRLTRHLETFSICLIVDSRIVHRFNKSSQSVTPREHRYFALSMATSIENQEDKSQVGVTPIAISTQVCSCRQKKPSLFNNIHFCVTTNVIYYLSIAVLHTLRTLFL